jgi:hypothetical protein
MEKLSYVHTRLLFPHQQSNEKGGAQEYIKAPHIIFGSGVRFALRHCVTIDFCGPTQQINIENGYTPERTHPEDGHGSPMRAYEYGFVSPQLKSTTSNLGPSIQTRCSKGARRVSLSLQVKTVDERSPMLVKG